MQRGIHSIFCDLGIYSRFSHFMQTPVSCSPYNHSLVHKPGKLPYNIVFKCSWNKSRPFLSMSSPNFRLPGGSLGYWTACTNFKFYCMLPYCVYQVMKYVCVIANPKYAFRSKYYKLWWIGVEKSIFSIDDVLKIVWARPYIIRFALLSP